MLWLQNRTNQVVKNIDHKFKGLKYITYILIILINLLFVFLVCQISQINDKEYVSINERFGPEYKFNTISVGDLTEQSFPRDFVKSPMCYTSIHHLNFIQIVALAQAAYLTDKNDINTIKDRFFKDTIFKDSNVKVIIIFDHIFLIINMISF